MQNPFNNIKLIEEMCNIHMKPTDEFNGPAFACVFPTMYCKAECEQCFFKSLPKTKCMKNSIPEEQALSSYGVSRTIGFLNDANVQYLLISGGGEPMENEEAVYRFLGEVHAERIVLVTSGYWAEVMADAKSVIDKFYSILKSKDVRTHFVIRLSLDECHYRQLGGDIVQNIVSVFRENYMLAEDFELQIHTLYGDNTINVVAESLGGYITDKAVNVSDGDELKKVVPYRSELRFDDGYTVKIGKAKMFYPSLKKNINKAEAHVKAIMVYEKDMCESEDDNPSVVLSGSDKCVKGLDFWIDKNGNVSTWGNQQPDQIYNIYTDDYKYIKKEILTKIGSRVYLDRGDTYRSNIIGEVNERAVLRTKAANIRDYAGMMILEEERTRLYYTVRAVQDYIREGKIGKNELENLSGEAKALLELTVEELQDLYHSSTYDIIAQTIRNAFNDKNAWKDLMLLVKLGHFDVSEANVSYMLEHYYMLSGIRYNSLNDVAADCHAKEQYARLLYRYTTMKLEAYYWCNDLGKVVA